MEWMNKPEEFSYEGIEPRVCILDCSLCIAHKDGSFCPINIMD